MAKKPKRDPYQEITDQIIDLIESGEATGEGWSKPWRLAAGAGLPHNAVGKRAYRGINVVVLWATAQVQCYPTNEWATYRQWQSVEAQVQKDEKGTLVILHKPIRVKPGDGEVPDGKEDDGRKEIWIARLWSVFNAAQVDGWESPVEDEEEIDTDERIEGWVTATGADIRYGDGESAHYSPGTDRIVVPRARLFKTVEQFQSARFHELTHWAGGESRLNRDLKGRFGDAAYAAEELIAELGAAFACGSFGIEFNERRDHAEYVAHWLQLLRNDKRAIVTAASRASEAFEYMNGLTQEAALAAA